MKSYRILFGLVLLVVFFAALSVGIIGVQGLAYQANTLTPDPNLTLTPSSTLPAVEQTVSVIETKVMDKRVEELTSELGNLKKSETSKWISISLTENIILGVAWFIFVVILVCRYRDHLSEILKVIVIRLRNSNMKYGDFEISVTDIDRVVHDRETLKAMLAVAISDNDPDPRELVYIAEAANDMDDNLDVLSSDNKTKIIKKALRLATVDKIFKDVEYKEIKKIAENYKIPVEDFNEWVREACQKAGIQEQDLPSQIK